MTIQNRKADHINICAREDITPGHCYWDDIRPVHNALPEIDADEIDMSCTLFGKRLEMPLVVTAITGGFPGATKINANIAKACAEMGVAMGVGSERAGITGYFPESFYVVKDYDVPLVIGNIGAPQLVPQNGHAPFTHHDVQSAMDLVDADIMAVHLNFLQEVVQPEGDVNARGCTEAIADLAKEFPIMVKETGGGVSADVARRISGLGIRGIDVAGMGGTSFAAVEQYRAMVASDKIHTALGATFFDWGIPSPVAVSQVKDCGLPVIASGGVLNGIHVASSIMLGATAAGLANAVLREAMDSTAAVVEKLTIIREELKAAMLLTGCSNLKELSKAPKVILGETRQWMDSL